MTDHDLAHLRELESAATSGPWSLHGWPRQQSRWHKQDVTLYAKNGYLVRPERHGGMFNHRADAELIAAMRNELPWLLDQAAENARLRERLARIEAAVERVRKRHPRGDEESSILAPGLWCPTCGRERGDNGYGACPDRAALAEPDAPEGSES